MSLTRDDAILFLVALPAGLIAGISGTYCWGRILGWW
jgi:hypothetical protein